MARRLSRRELLVGLAAAGGGGALLAAVEVLDLAGDVDRRAGVGPPDGDLPLAGTVDGTTVLVLGAGVAGLCCAYELGRVGYEVTVLEARSRTGGRSLTLRGGDTVIDTRGAHQQVQLGRGRWFDAGPARIAQHHRTLDYCRELGVPVEVFVNENADAFVEARGTVRRRRSVMADLDGYVSELLVKAAGRGALDEDVTRDERSALVAHLRSVGALGSARRGYAEAPGADGSAGRVDEPDDLGLVLGLGMGDRLAFERDWDMAMPMFHCRDGMDALAGALAEAALAAGATIRTGVAVVEVLGDSPGVAVALRGPDGTVERVEADHGVCTLPPHLAARLEGAWPGPVRRALEEPVPFTTGKLGLEYDRRFWELDDRVFGGISTTSSEPRVIWYPSGGYLGDGGVVVGAYPFGPAADRFSRLPHARRLDVALDAGSAIHGDAYRGVRSSVSVDWRTQPHSEGAWATWDLYGAGFSSMLEPHDRWWFAGDWLSRASGWQHGALESARRAVVGLHATQAAHG